MRVSRFHSEAGKAVTGFGLELSKLLFITSAIELVDVSIQPVRL